MKWENEEQARRENRELNYMSKVIREVVGA